MAHKKASHSHLGCGWHVLATGIAQLCASRVRLLQER